MDSEPLADLQAALERATPGQREHYHELMRHDPIAGDVYLRVLSLLQQGETIRPRGRTGPEGP
jgi:hypothetical protein